MRLKIVLCSLLFALVMASGWICNHQIDQSMPQRPQENTVGAWQQATGVYTAPSIPFAPRNYVQIVSIPADK